MRFAYNKLLRAGASGFIAKSMPKQDMLKAIRRILNGYVEIASEKNGFVNLDLSQRQKDTLNLLAQGHSNKEIAQKLNISTTTVKEYVSVVMSHLDVTNRTQAALKAHSLGMLELMN